MAEFSFISADEFRMNTPYHQIVTLEGRRGGVLIHSNLPPGLLRTGTWARLRGRGPRCGYYKSLEIPTLGSGHIPISPRSQDNRCSQLGRQELGKGMAGISAQMLG